VCAQRPISNDLPSADCPSIFLGSLPTSITQPLPPDFQFAPYIPGPSSALSSPAVHLKPRTARPSAILSLFFPTTYCPLPTTRSNAPAFAPCYPLCVHANTDCPICNSFVLITLQPYPGVGGIPDDRQLKYSLKCGPGFSGSFLTSLFHYFVSSLSQLPESPC
jgi:hypothetical protein